MHATASQQETLKHLLAEILDDPASNANRLVYADYIDEEGIDPDYSSFIRVQCELAKGCRTCDGTGRNVMSPCPCSLLRRRERELLDAADPGDELPHRVRWLCAEPSYLMEDALKPTFRRGFVESVRCTCAAFLAHGPQVVACQPVTRCVFPGLEPVRYGDRWSWFPVVWRGTRLPHHVPREWEKYLCGKESASGHYDYPTRELALSDLSAACLSWAKAEARRKELIP